MNLASTLYRRVFREEISPEVKSFIKRFSYVAAGSGIAAMLTFVFNVLGGRLLGPDEYGRFSLIQSLAFLLYIPMLLGFNTAMIKFAAEKADAERQANIITTTFILVSACTVVSAIGYLLFASRLANLLSVTTNVFYFSLVMAGLYVFYTNVTSMQRGLNKMWSYAVFQPVYGGMILLVFLLFTVGKVSSFKSMTYPMLIGYGVTGATILFSLVRYLRPKFDGAWARVLTKYSLFAAIAALSSALYTNIGKILISKYMSVMDVGIYTAYYSPSINVAYLLFLAFNAVLFPTISGYEDKTVVFRKLDKLAPYLVGPGTIAIFVFEFLVLRIYGRQYPVNALLMLIFALTSMLTVLYAMYASTFNSEGLKGVRLTSRSVVTIAILDTALSIYLIPRFGLYGAVGAITISFAAGICYLYLMKGILTSNSTATRP